ncbi:TPA: DUF2634 domain-containing protein [Clostridioides difficile]|uniref:Phage protein n=5 Tax=Clostridioides difficile TaxID=1496 RepID=A0AB74QK32_CLODI|nr:DUF2634 domain-containing protein [Clostridioides difficile]EGT2197685.1 DUF2634 domain-containing protein [Clostridioides difficile]EGT4248546.1 DUF2634 domain-containing protein [Clostridioides difficile]EGT4522521.1 DUF2634 domain-containing protein [Clostridioides difficile]EGT4918651.1 DUF2634 domain-containing protein [Clostridioides difficile]EGT4942685.1 DUF2634 domain-containing protein [Clostridioides difficile]
MLPSDNLDYDIEDVSIINFDVRQEPSKTFKLNIEKSKIDGICDDVEALKQTIFLILNTERYQHLIYSWNYGVELNDLIGEPISFVIPELERRIKEALIQDDRIENVDNFEFQNIKGKLQCRFSVHTKYGNIKAEKVVSV